MERVSVEEATKGMIMQLENVLAKLSFAAEAGISTSDLETKAQKLASKLKMSAEIMNGLSLYKDVKGNEIYQWHIADELPDDLFMKYANLCKKCKEQLTIRKDSDLLFAKVADGLFVSLVELPQVEMPEFKVRIEGNTLMAVRADLFAKLPEKTRKLLLSEGDNKEDE